MITASSLCISLCDSVAPIKNRVLNTIAYKLETTQNNTAHGCLHAHHATSSLGMSTALRPAPAVK